MRGTKWYKLNKSNESLQIFLNESFSKLEVTVGDKIADGVTRVGEVIFSAGIAFAIEQKYDPLDNVWKYLPFFLDEKLGYIRLTISSTVIFLAVMLISHMLSWALKKAKRTFRDNKATPKDAHALEQYFYKQVLNDIITGISLEKKADGLMKGHKFSTTKVQDSSLYLIYMVESVFYFGEAVKCIDELELFEIDNIRRKPYTDFLNSIDADSVCDIFQACIDTLDRIIGSFRINGKNTKEAQNAKKMFNTYKTFIKKQLRQINDLDSPPPSQSESLNEKEPATIS